jgi:hypothetical protein
MTQFQVHKSDLSQTRVVNQSVQQELQAEQVRVKIDAFSFTANNITYWAMGDKLAYWQFFPAIDNESSDWGVIPAWGFADVVASKHTEVPVGERLFGYFPTADMLVMQPVKVSMGLWFDGSPHRSKLPPGYNMYRRVAAEPAYNPAHDALRMLLFPLHITSFCIHDMLASQEWCGAEQILIISASSKTSLGLAFALQEDPSAPQVIGLTSKRNLDFVQQTGYYQQALSYDALDDIDSSLKTVLVDMSGNGELISQLHAKLQDNMLFSSHVGLTHWDETDKGPGFIAERSKMFFAPGHIQQRYLDWGPEKFEARATAFMQRAAADSGRWLEITTAHGLSGLSEQFEAISQGLLPAKQGLIIKL